MSRKALIVFGGWEGHQPKEVSQLFAKVLKEDGFEVELSNTLDSFKDEAKLKQLSLIVPIWTMGKITPEQVKPVVAAVQNGVGMAGCHGGMCDAFRDSTEWQFLTGAQWVSHPGDDGVKYRVKIGPMPSPITDGIKDFDVATEQYYLHCDPAVKVHATTRFPVADGPHASNGNVDVPVVFTKMYGAGKVFYNSLGHQANILEAEPCLSLMRRGFKWAAQS